MIGLVDLSSVLVEIFSLSLYKVIKRGIKKVSDYKKEEKAKRKYYLKEMEMKEEMGRPERDWEEREETLESLKVDVR